MQSIFLVTESEFDYDSHHHVNVKAFADVDAANRLRDELVVKQDRLKEIFPKVRQQFMLVWCADNPAPVYYHPDVSLPKWDSRNGKKKTADPAILAAFEAEVKRITELSYGGWQKHAARQAEWEVRAKGATHDLLVEAGMLREEAILIDNIGSYLYPTDYTYEVEEVEFA